MLSSLHFRSLLLRRTFDNMTEITNRKLDREVDRCERQCKEDPPPSSSRDESKGAGSLAHEYCQSGQTHRYRRTGMLTIRHFPATAALPCARFQNVPARREKTMVRPHSRMARQMLVRRQQMANMKDRKAMARR